MSGPNTYHWIFGNGDHIEFPNGGNPTVVSSSAQIATYEGCATISDQSGQLLAYTDGTTLWDRNNTPIGAANLGGHGSSTHSSIMVPPAGGGTNYHVFCIGDDTDGNADQVWHTCFTPVGGGSSIVRTSGPTNITGSISGYDNTERLAATSHADCNKYWVISQNKGLNGLYAFLVDSDGAPNSPVNTSMTGVSLPDPSQTGGNNTTVEQGYMKFSPDGRMFAWADGRSNNIHFHTFDNSTGAFTYMHSITNINGFPYGVEFSPDGNYLFYSILTGADAIAVHDISTGNEIYSLSSHIFSGVKTGALQIGPNGKIYAKYGTGTGLLEIDNPNLGASSTVNPNAIDSVLLGNISLAPPSSIVNGQTRNENWGLPTFTRIANNCLEGDVCSAIAEEVNEITSERAELDVNRMRHCDGRRPRKPNCREFQYRDPRPHIEVKWGDSECDCIESDDTEIVSITVCNTYSNIEFSSFTIHKLEVVDAAGNPVALLPDGTPSVELTPLGPYCFGNIASCSCVSREFVLRNRGAIAGEYHIRATGICYDVKLHFDDEACFKFDICAD